LRDEAHRFGITFHRQKRSKSFISSELNKISGIGEKTVQKLLADFKSVKNIRELDEEKLADSIGKSKARVVYGYFHNRL
jgi:excinuclease ABC subunit C